MPASLDGGVLAIPVAVDRDEQAEGAGSGGLILLVAAAVLESPHGGAGP